MKSGLIILAAASLAVATPHAHAHNHQQIYAKREAEAHAHARRHAAAAELEERASADVVWVCALGDEILTEEECQQGLKNGTLRSPDGPLTHASKPVSTPAPTKASSTSAASAPSSTQPTSSSAPTVQNKFAVNQAGDVSSSAPASKPSSAGPAGGSGADADFPDGQLDCSDFPDEYGAVSLPYLGLNGWSGVQCPGGWLGNLIDKIDTVVSGHGGCKEGCFCSYACPAGYQKIQWPSSQGATGQSVGGIECKNGKLHLTNPAFKTLCNQGTDKVKVVIKNNLSSNSAVCRTDYPGTESETIPLNTLPGSTNPLTCPESSQYYHWQGASTTAQYYVNNAGVSVEDACQWSSAGTNQGNWAPVNLGVGYNGEMAYLSIIPNKPTNPDAVLNFKITITGDNVSGSCSYENGQYCSGGVCNGNGCTVGVSSGTATYVFSD